MKNSAAQLLPVAEYAHLYYLLLRKSHIITMQVQCTFVYISANTKLDSGSTYRIGTLTTCIFLFLDIYIFYLHSIQILDFNGNSMDYTHKMKDNNFFFFLFYDVIKDYYFSLCYLLTEQIKSASVYIQLYIYATHNNNEIFN